MELAVKMNSALPDWRLSSHGGGQCVEAAKVTPAAADLIKAATIR
jgi:hypothetical protein